MVGNAMSQNVLEALFECIRDATNLAFDRRDEASMDTHHTPAPQHILGGASGTSGQQTITTTTRAARVGSTDFDEEDLGEKAYRKLTPERVS